MSTYNGEKYIREQIDSILAQKDVDLTLHIFDDISKDKTVEIAREYEEKNSNVKVHINERNKNFTYNFLDALFSFKENEEFDYYAFSDQDDYWLDTKLISAIKKIEEKGKCTLYAANLKVVDQDLNPTGEVMMPKKYKQGHYDMLCKNVVTGCTVVMDKDFKNLSTKHYPENIYLHDYWLAIIAHYTKTANYVYDTCPDYILYRQHGANLIGGKKDKGLIKTLFSKIDKNKSNLNLYRTYWNLYKDEVNDEDKVIIEKTAYMNKIKNRIYLVTHVKTFHPKGYFLNIMFNKY